MARVYTFPRLSIMDEKFVKNMIEEGWMTCLGKQCGRDWFKSWCSHYDSVVFYWHLQNVYLLAIRCWRTFFLFLFSSFFHMNKIALGFPSLYLGMSLIYASTINAIHVALTLFKKYFIAAV